MKTGCFALLVAMGLVLTGLDRPASAQLSRISGAAQQVYDQLPSLPREDQYSGKTDSSSSFKTLVQRLMFYHIQIKGRASFSRLDWKLTLADYLDLNETMVAKEYPGEQVFNSNPYNGDLAVIRALNRDQRNALLASILKAFGSDPNPVQPLTQVPRSLSSPPLTRPTTPPLPGSIPLNAPGSADLLK